MLKVFVRAIFDGTRFDRMSIVLLTLTLSGYPLGMMVMMLLPFFLFSKSPFGCALCNGMMAFLMWWFL